MTKTLTEQWREGTLPDGYYYTKGAFDDDIYISHLDYEIEEDKRLPVEEVLAPVPSYEEYKELVSKTDKLEKMAFHYTPEEWNTMMRMVEHLQEQIKDANEVIDACCSLPETNWVVIDSYREKWGVK